MPGTNDGIAECAFCVGAGKERLSDETQLADAVIAARVAGASWQKIGSLLGTSAQAAQQRYGALVEAG